MRKLSTYEGVVENGQVKLPPEARIPETTRVYIVVPTGDSGRIPKIASPRLVHPEQAKDFENQIIEDLTDAGE